MMNPEHRPAWPLPVPPIMSGGTRSLILLSSVLAALLFLQEGAVAQTTVGVGSYAFSDGVHPTFSFVFEGTGEKQVEGHWRDELKRISHAVSWKKEVIGAGALVPQVSPDTVRVLVKAEQRKGSPLLTAHVAILTRDGWVGPGSDAAVFEGARSFVQERSIALKRQLAQQALDAGTRQLGRLRNELATLVRDHERMEQGIKKSLERADEAAREQEHLRREQADLGPRITEQRAINASEPTEENAKELAGLMKQQARLEDRLRKAQDKERGMRKRAEDLAWEVKKNAEDQERKSNEVAAQDKAVEALRARLEAIH